jgi:hypothetical protein
MEKKCRVKKGSDGVQKRINKERKSRANTIPRQNTVGLTLDKFHGYNEIF